MRERIADSQSRILVTMDGYYGNGELIDHPAKADGALERAHEEGAEVEKVLVWRRHVGEYASKSPMVEGPDFFVDELLADYCDKLVELVSIPAEAPALRDVHEGDDGPAEGLPAQHRRISAIRRGDVEVLPGRPP